MVNLKFFSSFHEIAFLLTHPWLVARSRLTEDTISEDPFAQFASWYKTARLSLTTEFPNAMSLSTIDEFGHPDGRMVLMKSFDNGGFVFYTNFESRKGRSLAKNPFGALTFYWSPIQRQVRIQGNIEKVSEEESDKYFASRPPISQIGAWASEQSRVLEERSTLDESVSFFTKKFARGPIPRPPHWGGCRLIPTEFEFWQLRLNRLHDRFQYSRGPSDKWEIVRLYP